MSGIVGLWNLDGAPVERALLERLAAALGHRGPDARGFWVEGPLGMAACLLRVTPESLTEVQPVVQPGEAVCVFDGRLDNREEILDVARGSSPREPSGANGKSALPDSAMVLAAYLRYGEKFVERLNGDFAFAVFDIRQRQLLLARDYLGIRPLYYARKGDTFLFASEIKAILAYPGFPRVPNEDALAVFLAQGISQDERGETLFAGVFNCPPAHTLTVTPDRTVARRYWSFDQISAPPATSSRDHLENFRWHLERAVQRRIRGAYPVAVSVSGGLDSSSVFCVAETMQRNSPSSAAPILGVTLTYPQASPADERQFIAEIERQYGVALVQIPAEPARDLSTRISRDGVWHAEIPLLDFQWNESHNFYTKVAALGARVVLTGHWGDQVLGDQSHLVDLFYRLKFSALRARLRSFPHWMTDAVPGYVAQRFWQDLLRYQKRYLPDFLVRALRRLRARHGLPAVYSDDLRLRARRAEWRKKQVASALASFHAQSLVTVMQSNYYLSCFEENNKAAAIYGLEVALPFLDRDVLSFVIGSPPEAYSEGAVPRGLLRQAMRGLVPGAILDRRGKADFADHVNASVSSQFAGIVSALQGESRVFQRGYVVRDSFARELERWHAEIQSQGPTCDAAWKLQRLYRLELWLQAFFGEAEKNNSEVSSFATQSVTLPAARQ